MNDNDIANEVKVHNAGDIATKYVHFNSNFFKYTSNTIYCAIVHTVTAYSCVKCLTAFSHEIRIA